MSVNGLLLSLAYGSPSLRQRKVTICARVQFLSGLKVVVLVPLVILFYTAQSTAFS